MFMKIFSYILTVSVALIWASMAVAQQTAWVQVEAQPSLREAQERARAYASAFENVNGFSLASGWYVIAIGPFTPAAAGQRLQQLQIENLIPQDSYVSDGNAFRQQFWPVGATALSAQPLSVENLVIIDPAATDNSVENVTNTAADVAIPEETRRQARRSEGELNRDERKMLQIALAWEGYYKAAIDGDFGRGTRGAMATYQTSIGYEASGILTTRQRQELLNNYNAILAGLDLQLVVDNSAYIEMQMPNALVQFDRFEPPFVHYAAKDNSGVRVLLVSQEGDRNTLYGLYDIMQTLEIVPLSGDRERKKDSFTLTGQNDLIQSYTYVALKDGLVKGFTLVWPAGDKKRMDRVVQSMRSSFLPFGSGALDELLGDPDGVQSIDLLAGLDIRRPDLSRSGFYVDGLGTVLTTNEVVQECGKITLNDTHEAEVVFSDATLGITLLRPSQTLAPIAFAAFSTKVPRLQSDVAVAGYSYGGVLGAPTLTYGQMANVRGLRGEAGQQRLAMTPLPGDAGGPVFDAGGGVVGMLLPKIQDSTRSLPDNVSFAANANAIASFLNSQGITVTSVDISGMMVAEDLFLLAADMTVLVSCWN